MGETCRCLIYCPVFNQNKGSEWDQCGKDESSALKAIDQASLSLLADKDKCEGLKCIMHCTQQMDCLDEEITGRCLNLLGDIESCNYDCIELVETQPEPEPELVEQFSFQRLHLPQSEQLQTGS